jgi:hypothetical protein
MAIIGSLAANKPLRQQPITSLDEAITKMMSSPNFVQRILYSIVCNEVEMPKARENIIPYQETALKIAFVISEIVVHYKQRQHGIPRELQHGLQGYFSELCVEQEVDGSFYDILAKFHLVHSLTELEQLILTTSPILG